MPNPEVSVLLPNYKTPEITKICLRLIKKHTDTSRIRLIAIDNDSGDESVEYLRSLGWIELIERPHDPNESPSESHSHALDDAMQRVDTPYVLSMHTDTFVRREGWLDFLLNKIKANEDIAGVGSWKLELKPLYKRVLKRIEYHWQSVYFPLVGKGYGSLEGKGDNFLYLRSHCALYRTDLIRTHNLCFSQDNDTAGRMMHKYLVEAGYKMEFIPSEILVKYMVHLNHATMVLNPELGSGKRSISKGLVRIRQMMDELQAEQILQDESLDR